jgi:5-methylcytosine-specific restriction protein A
MSPMAALRFCGYAGCHKYALPGGYYCEDHRQAAPHAYDKARYTEAEHRFYKSPEWRAARAQYLQDHPLCENCLAQDRVTPATLVHHKQRVRDHPELALDPANFKSLCDACHNPEHPEKGGRHDD